MADPIVVTVEQGKLQGKREKDLNGKEFYSFMGIPYAEPPVGKLRFRDPQPAKSWSGIKDATQEGQVCISSQMVPTPDGLNAVLGKIGSEDCLILNVFTPTLRVKTAPKAVMVYIHGGAFVTGSSARALYGPEFLVSGDVVLVTLNYRLGVLGFLASDDKSLKIPGNAGLKDMVLALKWVKKNIENFGGNPNNVTIFGESAGAAAVHMLVLSPLAKGLFQRAIAQSGSVFSPWAYGVNDIEAFAAALGYSEGDLSDFLAKQTAEKIVDTQQSIDPDVISSSTKRPFSPSLESPSPTALMSTSENPITKLQTGVFNTDIDLMMGYTTHEGMLIEGVGFLPIKMDTSDYVPFFYEIEKGSELHLELKDKIKEFYGRIAEKEGEKEALYAVLSDVHFVRGVQLSAKLHLKNKTPGKKIYLYRFSLDEDLNVIKKIMRCERKGACHGDDIGYLFATAVTTLKPGSVEEVAVKRMVTMWTNFAKYGNPIVDPKDPLFTNVKWDPVESTTLNFLDIGKDLVTVVNPEKERMEFWDSICEKVAPGY